MGLISIRYGRGASVKSVLFLLSICLYGCGSSPTAPTPPVPNLQGQWSGNYRVTSCQETGAADNSGFCFGLINGGGMAFTPQQSGSYLSGTVSIGVFTPIPVSGTVGTDNSVVLTGSGPIQLNASLALNQFRGSLTGTTITGTLQYTITTNVPIGTGVVSATFTIQR